MLIVFGVYSMNLLVCLHDGVVRGVVSVYPMNLNLLVGLHDGVVRGVVGVYSMNLHLLVCLHDGVVRGVVGVYEGEVSVQGRHHLLRSAVRQVTFIIVLVWLAD
jgi:hypothetical protein